MEEGYCTVCGIIAELDEGLCEDCWTVAADEDPTLMFELVDIDSADSAQFDIEG